MNIKVYVGVVLVALIVIFTVQNAAVVSINFLFWDLSVSRALMIFFVVIIGFLIGWISAGVHYRAQRRRNRSV
jgi:uncharacterized integral membrane protein